MKTAEFKNALNKDPSGLAVQPFAINSDFNEGFPYLVSISLIISGDMQTIKHGEPLILKVTMPYFVDSSTAPSLSPQADNSANLYVIMGIAIISILGAYSVAKRKST